MVSLISAFFGISLFLYNALLNNSHNVRHERVVHSYMLIYMHFIGSPNGPVNGSQQKDVNEPSATVEMMMHVALEGLSTIVTDSQLDLDRRVDESSASGSMALLPSSSTLGQLALFAILLALYLAS